ncbi:Probable 2-phosphosulfolactate phosphatase [Porphyromonas macacae]|uniref:Probable 2-phosphosulfolactate phosphatase n=1 Tax=Porphyromonas macacae TaxID=28115 RepID=A0A379E921_9PORP|nr:2-phosphosulfolactate phosphatase [Porphyromonas macacae]SUB89166.1 Probable 2-phosphosulfolactate phosphatase [Porphyromonas macacae]
MLKIHLCPSPDLYELYHRSGAAVIVVDIFRASTTIVTALSNGAKGILPVTTTEEARIIGTKNNYLIAAERNVRKCDFALLGNDPSEYLPEIIQEKRIVFTTTNGTKSIRIALENGAKEVLVGAFINLSATIDYLQKKQYKEVIVLAAGWKGQMCMEDSLYAGALVSILLKNNQGDACNDGASMAKDLWNTFCSDETQRLDYLKKCEHYKRLEENRLANVVPYCLKMDTKEGVYGVTGTLKEPWITKIQ